MWTCSKIRKIQLSYICRGNPEYAKHLYSGYSGMQGYWYLYNTDTQTPVLNLEGIAILLKY